MANDSNNALPIEPTLDSITRWLSGLLVNNSERERYTLLFSGLQALNSAEFQPELQFKAFEKIRAPVFQATTYLTSLYLGKPLPLEPGIRKLAKLSVQFQVELAQGYYALTRAKGFGRIFNMEDQGRILHCALQSYSQMFLRLALMYEAPSSSTWLQVNEIYRLAERGNLSGWSGKAYEQPHSASCSIEDLYLCMLVFRLLNPYRLGQTEIQMVFDVVQQYGKEIALGHIPFEDGRKAEYTVDLDSTAMPVNLSWGDDSGKGDLRYLYFQPLRRTLASLGRPPLNIDSGLSERLSHFLYVRLGGHLPKVPDNKSVSSTVVAGFKNLVEAMSDPGAKSTYNLQELDEYVLTFANIDSSKTAGTFTAPGAAPAVAPVKPVSSLFREVSGRPAGRVACRVWPADAKGFYFVEGTGLDLRPECLVGMFTDDKLNQFGQVCPARTEGSAKTFCIELLASQVSLVKVYFDANPKKRYRGFFSPMGNGSFSLITSPLRMRGGDGLGIGDRELAERYLVVKMLEKTAEFCQYEIIPEPVSNQFPV